MSPGGKLSVGSLLVLVGLGAGLVVSRWPDTFTQSSYAQDVRGRGADSLAAAESLSAAFQHVAKSVGPAVVSVHSVQRARPVDRGRRERPDMPDEFRRFFGDDLFERFFDGATPQQGFDREGLGSGVVISQDGYILTNNHVVRGADELKVTLADGREFEAKVVGSDPKTDLAALKIQATGLTAARLGNSDAVEVGQWVVAIGSPFEYPQTVTAGIVSAKGRDMSGRVADYEDFIQTDAAINPGNSGGPLVNLRGEVIGINTAIATRTGSYSGLGFAISSNIATEVKNAILKHGRVERGQLGTRIQDLTPDLAREYKLDSTQGVLVADVIPNGPAEKAGVRPDDVIIEFNGESVKNMRELRLVVARTAPGTSVTLTVMRAGQRKTLPLVLERMQDEAMAAQESARDAREASEPLGVTVQTLTPEVARQLRIDEHEKGVAVTGVEPGSTATRAGIRPGDVIVSVGDQPVMTVQEFRAAMEKQDLERGLRLRVKRDGAARVIFLRSQAPRR